MNVRNLIIFLLFSILIIVVVYNREMFLFLRQTNDTIVSPVGDIEVPEADNEIIGYIYPSRAGSLQASAKSADRPHTILYRYAPYMKKIE